MRQTRAWRDVPKAPRACVKTYRTSREYIVRHSTDIQFDCVAVKEGTGLTFMAVTSDHSVHVWLYLGGDSISHEYEWSVAKPHGIAVTRAGDVVVTTGTHQVIVFGENGAGHVKKIGTPGSGPLQFRDPAGVTITSDHHVAVADRMNHRIQIVSLDGALVRQWGGLIHPTHIAAAPGQLLVVMDNFGRRIQTFREGGGRLHEFSVYPYTADHCTVCGSEVLVSCSDSNVILVLRLWDLEIVRRISKPTPLRVAVFNPLDWNPVLLVKP